MREMQVLWLIKLHLELLNFYERCLFDVLWLRIQKPWESVGSSTADNLWTLSTLIAFIDFYFFSTGRAARFTAVSLPWFIFNSKVQFATAPEILEAASEINPSPALK